MKTAALSFKSNVVFEKINRQSSHSSLLDSAGATMVSESVHRSWVKSQDTLISYGRSMLAVCGPLLRRRRETLMSLFASVFLLVLYFMYMHLHTTTQILGYGSYSPNGQALSNAEIAVEQQQQDNLIPHKIWQIFLTPPLGGENFTIDPIFLGDTASWIARNPDYTYTLVSSKHADDFMQAHFSGNHDILHIYNSLRNPGMKSDFLRYLILYVEGGTYADTDVYAHKPVDAWIPAEFRSRAKVVVGVEFDRLDNQNWGEVHPDLQFCQWTIAAAPGHPLFMHMTYRAMDALRDLERTRNKTLSQLHVEGWDVINSTGPASWTDAVFEQLQTVDPDLTQLRQLSGMREPRLYGDILVLPIDSFGMGQPHSNSTNDGTVPETALIEHNFRGSWRMMEQDDMAQETDDEEWAKENLGWEGDRESPDREETPLARPERARKRETKEIYDRMMMMLINEIGET